MTWTKQTPTSPSWNQDSAGSSSWSKTTSHSKLLQENGSCILQEIGALLLLEELVAWAKDISNGSWGKETPVSVSWSKI
jgi:hypothetical protein